jgi:hypothetical protein
MDMDKRVQSDYVNTKKIVPETCRNVVIIELYIYCETETNKKYSRE